MKMNEEISRIIISLIQRLRQLSKRNGLSVIVTMISGTVDRFLEAKLVEGFDRILNVDSEFNPYAIQKQPGILSS